MKKIAFPSSIQGLHADISEHFGHTPAFTIITYDSKKDRVIGVEIIQNAVHQPGECMTPILLLKNLEVTDIVVKKMGKRARMGLLQSSISLYLAIPGTVKENFTAFREGKLDLLTLNEEEAV